MASLYTPLLTGAAATAANFNSRFQEIENAILAYAGHAGRFTNLDYGAVGDGATDDSDAIEDALAAGGVVVGEPGAVYRVTRAIPLVSNTIFDLNGATILQNGVVNSTGFFYAAGSQGSKVSFTSNQTSGSNAISLPTGEGSAGAWAAGDLIVVESDDIDIDTSGTDTFCKEMYKVKGVSGDTLYIDGALIRTYTTANSAKYSKATPKKNIFIKNFKATNEGDATYVGYSIRFDFCENIKLENIHLYDCGGGIPLYDTYGFHIKDALIEDVTDFSGGLVAYGYGIFPGSTACFGTIENYRAANLRHAFTTISEQRTGPTARYGSPRHIVVKNGFGTASNIGGSDGSTAIWDTHEAGYDVVFENLVAMGGVSSLTHGFQLRSPTKLINCTALYCGGRGVNSADGSAGTVVLGGEFGYNELCGLSTRAGMQIIAANIHHNQSTGGIALSGDDVIVKDCTIHDNNSYGILYSSGARPRIENNYIPFSTGVQTIGLHTFPATAVIRNNDFGTGWSGDDAVNSVVAGATVERNIGFVTEAEGATSVADGGTISHGIQGTPTSVVVSGSVSGEFVSVTAIGSSTFTVAIKTHAGAAGTTQTVYWRAKRIV